MSGDNERQGLLGDEAMATSQPQSTGPTRLDLGHLGSDDHGEHPMQNYLARLVSIICLFCLVTTGIVLSVGHSTGDAANNPVDFSGTPANITPTSPTGNPQMEPIGPEELERFLYIAMIAGLLWMIATLVCPKLLIVQTTNRHGCSGQLDKSVLHLLGATLIFAVGAAFLPLIDLVAYFRKTECFPDQAWSYDQSEWVLYQICHFLFIFIQPLFFFKYVQNGAQLKFCRGFSHFALMWLMGTNVSLWFHILVEESLVSHPRSPTLGLTYMLYSTDNISCPGSSSLHDLLLDIRPILHPFVLEYSLISAGLFLNLWNRIGKRRTRDGERSEQQTGCPPQQTTSQRMPIVGGVILGLVVVLVLAVTTIYHYTKLNDFGIKTDICNNTVVKSGLDTTFVVYYGYSIIVSVIMLFGCLMILFHPMIQIIQGLETSVLLQSCHDTDPQHKNHIWIDTALLISSAIGVFLINGFGIAAAVGLSNSYLCGTISHWYMADCALGTIQCIAQLLLITGGLHQQWAGTKRHPFVFSCLFIVNVGLWGNDLYEVKNITTTALGQVYFGSSVWSVVIHIAYPLCIFFRLHSAATLFPLMMKSCRVSNVGGPEDFYMHVL